MNTQYKVCVISNICEDTYKWYNMINEEHGEIKNHKNMLLGSIQELDPHAVHNEVEFSEQLEALGFANGVKFLSDETDTYTVVLVSWVPFHKEIMVLL